MPYKTNADLPSTIKSNLPDAAQSIWRGAFNGFSSSNPDADEKSGYKVAWAAVKKKFKKVKDNWVALSDAFSPDQPRNEHGQWTSGEGGQTTNSLSKLSRALQAKHEDASNWHQMRAADMRERDSKKADVHQHVSGLHRLAADNYRQAAEYFEKGELQKGAFKHDEADIHAQTAEDKSFSGNTMEPAGYWSKPIKDTSMKTMFCDAVVFDGIKTTKDGYLTGYANVARTGIQLYKGSELGRPELHEVKVYRPPEEVFSDAAMRSMAHRPITFPHPPVMVNSRNWNKYAKGHTGDEVIRDGDHVRVPMVVMDAATITAVKNGEARELSLGYSTDLKWRKGKTPSGENYDAVQTAIRGNHLAIVPAARGGTSLRLGDQADDTDDMCPKCGMELEGDPDECPYCLEDLTDSATYDREFSEEQRKEHAKSGKALPDGSFPIVSLGDLNNAIKAVGRAKSYGAAKAHIIKRAKALGATSSLPSDWVKSDTKDAKTGDKVMSAIVLIDGASIEVADELSASVIRKHIATLNSQLADAKAKADKAKADQEEEDEENEREQTDAKKQIAAKDGEIVVLKKQLADAKAVNTPEVLDALVKQRSAVIDSAKLILGATFTFDGKRIEDIRRAAVTAKIGDAAKDMSDDGIDGAFKALTAGDHNRRGPDRLADSIALHNQRSNGERSGGVDLRDAALAEREKWLNNAWRGDQKQS